MTTPREAENRRQSAIRLLRRKRGATVEELAQRLGLPTHTARNLIDGVRRHGVPVKNVGRCRFKTDA